MGKVGWLAAAALLLAVGCTAGAGAASVAGVVATISPAEAAGLVDDPPEGLVILDVRTPEEFAAARLRGAANLDFYAPTFSADLAALDRRAPYLLYCRTASRSEVVREMMRTMGFSEVYELAGGIVAWAGLGLPLEVP